jgi:hypothetical protein
VIKQRSRRIIGLALALAALTLWLAVGTASAHKAGYSSSLVLQPKLQSDTVIEYSGKVNSEAKLCRAGRAVDLYLGGVYLTRVSTDPGGNWSVTGIAPPKGTAVTAVVKRKLKRKKRHRHKCAPDSVTKKAQ